ncbi:MAG: beta-lactamase family protein [Archangiaceae bacterium]|nr:beta-lactamase family protein [Archangiaceae bacterium]
MISAILLCLGALPEGDQALVDAWAKKTMTACHAPGLAVSVVRRGAPALARGYGFADLDAKLPVDPERTRFAIASVTKSITATAVMLAVDEHKLELNADVNAYLEGFEVPPVTLHQLLTHTSGFDDSLLGAAALTPNDIVPLGRFLAAHVPQRVAPAGTLWSYSNRNYSLAGHLLERAYGLTYAQFVEQRIFAPLQMQHSAFAAPADPAELARAYDVTGSGATASPLWPWTHDVPAGGMSSTAGDMARFVAAHLGEGPLPEHALAATHPVEHRFHPGLPGMTYAFMEEQYGGRRALMHDGNMGAFGALIYLVPELGLGVFAAVNGGGEACDLVSLAHTLVGEPAPRAQPPAVASRHDAWRSLEGTYRSSRYPHATFEKASVVLGLTREIDVRAQPDGTLQVGRGRYVEVAPLLFQRVDGEGLVAFSDGALSNGMATTYQRVPWHGALGVHRLVLVASVAVFLAVALVVPLAALWRRWRRRAPAEPLVRRARLWSWLLATGSLLFLAGLASPFFGKLGPYWLLYELPASVKAVFALPFALAVGAVATVFAALATWKRGAGTRAGRVAYSFTGLAGVGFVSFLAYWNLLGFRF